MNLLTASSIDIAYADAPIVHGVTLELVPGKTIALAGPNGAGKTTILKALNGGLPVVAGAVELDGKPLGEYSRREIARRIAVIAQENETRFPVTVIEFVLAGRFAHGASLGWETEADHWIARTALGLCDLEDYAERLMNQLSGGEQQ
ncbi:MAG TPA: ABC transporter ATP-binding protein, partial [Pyrinomonadaceae bacterium]|nr:ABC transporter ATP-binding protein [Pyrinomonadaceae bacterium]